MAGSFSFGNNNIYTSSLQDPCFTTSPFQNDPYPTFDQNDSYQSNLEPLSPTWDSFIATPQFTTPNQELSSTTSDYFTKDALLFADSPVEESPQTPKFSGDYVSLFPLQNQDTCDRKDTFTSSGSTSPVIDHMSISHATPPTSTTNPKRRTVSNSNYSENSSESPSSGSEKRRYSSGRSSKGSTRSPGSHRLNHNTIEKRYRTNLNEQISNLWNVVAKDESSDAQQPSKSAVLAAARKYILELQTQNKRAETDLEEARMKCKTCEQLLTDHLGRTGVKVARIGKP